MVLVVGLFFQASAATIGVRNAMSAHYELDKKAYSPGDSGRMLLVVGNDEDPPVDVYGAQMNITGIGFFETSGLNMSCPVWSTDVYQGGHACLLERGTPLNIAIVFKIPIDAQSREYAYSWGVEEGRGQLGSVLWPTGSGTLWVARPGETPIPIAHSQADQLNGNLQLLVLIGIPLLALAYPLVKWRSRLSARFVVAAIAILLVLGKNPLGPFIFVPLAALALLAAIYSLAGWLLHRRKTQSPVVTELSAGAKKVRRIAKWIIVFGLLAAGGLIAAAFYAASQTGAMISPVPNTPLYGYLTMIWAWYDDCTFIIVAALSAYYVAGGVKAKSSKLSPSQTRTKAPSVTPPETAHSIPKFCQKCGAPTAPNFKFCLECGTDK